MKIFPSTICPHRWRKDEVKPPLKQQRTCTMCGAEEWSHVGDVKEWVHAKYPDGQASEQCND